MRKVSQTVSDAVSTMYAKMASKAASKAIDLVGFGSHTAAAVSAKYAEEWLVKAGAKATRQHFSIN